ncbi:MAG: hypothetical protein GY710_09680 [Desulfobacteraceae bacterium]|nr:hypothetical protein [Desulfobacteraceae bacterium]
MRAPVLDPTCRGTGEQPRFKAEGGPSLLDQTKEKRQNVVVVISDTGCGIEEKYFLKIFDPFFTTREIGKGTGLGLNISYNIIKEHNGKIDVKSKIDEGTTFTITLPIKFY